MKLRHPRSKLSQYKEEQAPKRTLRSKLTQWVYLAVVLFVVAYVIFYIAYTMFYFDQRGLVVVDHVVIASKHGGRILEMPVSVGDHVRKGALLLRVASPNTCRQGTNNKTIRELKIKNGLDKGKLHVLIRQLNAKEHELKQMKYQRSMELFAGDHARMQSLQDDILALNGNIDGLRRAIRLRDAEIKTLSGGNAADDACQDEVIRAPSDGTVVAMPHRVFEVLQRTEPVMDFVPDDARVSIHMDFKNENYNDVSVGKEVTIRFPNGESGKGKITGIKSTSVPFAINESQHYRPGRTRVLAIIEPLNEKEADLWKSFMEMEVKVRGWR